MAEKDKKKEKVKIDEEKWKKFQEAFKKKGREKKQYKNLKKFFGIGEDK